jgi:hypothetical protein
MHGRISGQLLVASHQNLIVLRVQQVLRTSAMSQHKPALSLQVPLVLRTNCDRTSDRLRKNRAAGKYRKHQ